MILVVATQRSGSSNAAGCEIEWGRSAASCDEETGASLTVGGEGEAGLDVLTSQVGEVCQNFVDRHPSGQVLKDVINGDAQTADAGLLLNNNTTVLVEY